MRSPGRKLSNHPILTLTYTSSLMDSDNKRPIFLFTTLIKKPSWSLLLFLLTLLTLSLIQISTKSLFPLWGALITHKDHSVVEHHHPRSCSGFYRARERMGKVEVVVSIKEFGGVGDGKTSNTEAFRKAMSYLELFGGIGGGGSRLNVPRGRWLTGSFNLTSNFTLFLQHGAVILGSQDPEEWPVIEPLPSYGRGRERLGGRHISLIHGNNLSNVVITGENGTIDGQGKMWWDFWWNRTLEYTRGHLVELMNSHNILISNLTFLNSPFWTIHPVYCSDVVIKGMTILAPLNSPNTDGIDPDSSTNVCIEDCYIESGDDLVAVKSGWDHYGIKMALPSSNVIVRNITGTTPTCSGVGIGSEMSGGIFNIHVEDLHVQNSASGVRVKTDIGRGGYITNITINNITLDRVKIPIRFSRGSNDHPDEGWDPKALPKVKGIYISNMISRETGKAPVLDGIQDAPFEEICISNVSILGLSASAKWQCEFISGVSLGVSPSPCPHLQTNNSSWCQHS